jgi:SAM-dependent methyltransferase
MKNHNSFLDVFSDKRIVSRFTKHIHTINGEKSALVLGFGDTDLLAMTYHDLGIGNIVGIEIQHALKLIEEKWASIPNQKKPASPWASWFDVYTSTVTVDKSCFFSKIDSLEAFDEAFTLLHATDMCRFLQGNTSQFDLIVASNSLHHLENPILVSEALQAIKSAVGKNGIFYIRVKEFPEGATNPLPLAIYRALFDDIFGRGNFEVFLQEKGQVLFPHEGRALTFWNV